MSFSTLPCILVSTLLVAAPAHAGTSMRYALVVGNDQADPALSNLEPLRHAEREARELAGELVARAGFDPARVEAVTGGSRAQVLAAARRLAERHRADQQQLGPLTSLFALFFTGHGQSGQLLTSSGALGGEDLSAIARQMGATLTVGFFDSCYAGSFDFASLRAKGVTVTPGFNPVAELPMELLDSEGAIWLVSSRAGEVSYEDQRFGGLFTHFFIEAFTEADDDGVGVPLETMWEYARRRTAATAAQHGRSQTPEKIVRDLKVRDPIYFSFPRKRASRLRFAEEVEGVFLLQYAQAGLSEKIVKARGLPLEISAYKGTVVLSRVDATGPSRPSRSFQLAAGETVFVRGETAEPTSRPTGFGESVVVAKGDLPGLQVLATTPRSVVTVSAGWQHLLLASQALAAAESGNAGIGLTRGPLSLELQLSWGQASRSYEAWSCRLHETGVRLAAGAGFELGPARLDFLAMGGPRLASARYGSGAEKDALGASLGGAVRLQAALLPRLLLEARAGFGARFAEGLAAVDRERRLLLEPSLELGLALPLAAWR